MEEFKNQELSDNELEGASGGANSFAAQKTCPKCGGVMLAQVNPQRGVTGYFCGMCSYSERA